MNNAVTPEIQQRVKTWKDRLADLSKRNRLLYFKKDKPPTVEISNPESISILFEAHTGEKPRPLPVDELETRQMGAERTKFLKKLRKEANSLLKEKGVNSLFVAIGTLTWNVAEKSKELITSPILLIPVELRKTSRKQEYTLYSTEEEVSLNPVLVQKLSADFGITLPESEIERNLGYDKLLNGVRQAVADRPNWTVENTAYISLFQRTKAAMIRDIERLEQNEEIIATHPILQALAGNSSAVESNIPQKIDARELDERVAPESVFQILEADSSQQEVIEAAKAGLSFVVQGPPGTGKSQTIVNMIAELIGAKKRVLLVSEKETALEVVFNRLKDCGLEDTCLNLHHRVTTNKEELMSDLEKAVRLQELRDRLRNPAHPARVAFKPFFSTEQPDLERIRRALDWLIELRKHELDTEKVAAAISSLDCRRELERLRDELETTQEQIEAGFDFLLNYFPQEFIDSLKTQSLEEVGGFLNTAENELDLFQDWLAYQDLIEQIEALGAGAFLSKLRESEISPESWYPVLEKGVYENWLQYIHSNNPELRNFHSVVIFDEASQIRTEEAIPSIMRAKQVIIVGDNKQLPPTSFFVGTSSDEEDDEDEDIYESVLDECWTFMENHILMWHYRSQDESLIAFSNQKVYESQLISFPNPVKDPNRGVHFRYVEEGIYARGGRRDNIREAEEVARLTLKHVQQNPQQSLGIIAFSKPQSDAIEEQLDRLSATNPNLEEFCQDNSPNFFLKPLERVQGDERDVIILSFGYGFDSQGELIHNFGPLSRQGGERRLNVAITRAKYKLVLVASIQADNLDPSRTNSRGVALLKDYLAYAASGGKKLEGNRSDDLTRLNSPLEDDIYHALIERNYLVERRVGCSDYRIDLAVRNDQRDEFLLGIECDGVTYHRYSTVRDRDRLRRLVLEKLGWRIHRIWSREWFRDRNSQIEQLVSRLEPLRP